MVKIPHMTGMDTSAVYLATVSATENTVTVTPMTNDRPVLMANTAPNINVHPALKRLLDKAGISPPPPGQVLTVAHVQERLDAAGLSSNDRIAIKQQLVGLRMLQEGVGIDIHSFQR